MNALIALAEKYWRPLALMLLVAFSLWRAYNLGVDSTNRTWSLKWTRRDLVDSTAALHAEVLERAKEQQRQHDTEQEAKNAQTALVQAHAEFAAAESAADGLREKLTTIQRQLARSETGRISAAASASAAKAQTGILLAELLGEADDLAGKFAKEADERYVAGTSCERTYDRVTGK
ncbi:TPA: DUF2514 family protein [Escherichia coli]|uniref:DUF2514 family protein n=1 Tax=Hafnia paralvei TaxID=546367 RepID=UPI001AFD33E1|nr:DUF2514 family protein [Hafnia paralvei]MBU2672615.1 DUF2514 family protein [Hafnia paralvei]HBA3651386.1 DUF2514 family protein [Escherichia coli]